MPVCAYIYIYIYIYILIYTHIYIYREREKKAMIVMGVYIYIYIYIDGGFLGTAQRQQLSAWATGLLDCFGALRLDRNR